MVSVFFVYFVTTSLNFPESTQDSRTSWFNSSATSLFEAKWLRFNGRSSQLVPDVCIWPVVASKTDSWHEKLSSFRSKSKTAIILFLPQPPKSRQKLCTSDWQEHPFPICWLQRRQRPFVFCDLENSVCALREWTDVKRARKLDSLIVINSPKWELLRRSTNNKRKFLIDSPRIAAISVRYICCYRRKRRTRFRMVLCIRPHTDAILVNLQRWNERRWWRLINSIVCYFRFAVFVCYLVCVIIMIIIPLTTFFHHFPRCVTRGTVRQEYMYKLEMRQPHTLMNCRLCLCACVRVFVRVLRV